MIENSKNSLVAEIDEIFNSPPSLQQKAWSIINEFYHLVLTQMEKENISKAELSKRLGRSRSAISQILNKTPNITVKKMAELAEAVGLELSLVSIQERNEFRNKPQQIYKVVVVKVLDKYEKQEAFADFGALNIGKNKTLTTVNCSNLPNSVNSYHLH